MIKEQQHRGSNTYRFETLTTEFSRRGAEVTWGDGSTKINASKLSSQRSHGPDIPNDQLPVNSGRTDPSNRPTLPFVGSDARDSVLMNGEQLRFSLRASTGTKTGETPRIRILEGVKGRAVQPPWSTGAEFGRTEGGLRSRCVVEASGKPPSAFVSGEHVGLAIVTSCDDSVLGRPYEGDERESVHSDGTDCGPRSRVDDADGAVVTFGSKFNIFSVEGNTKYLPAKARTSPDGEKATVCTQPPAGLGNSPQTVPNGSLSPQNVGAGLKSG